MVLLCIQKSDPGILRQENGWEETLDAVRPKIQERFAIGWTGWHGVSWWFHGGA